MMSSARHSVPHPSRSRHFASSVSIRHGNAHHFVGYPGYAYSWATPWYSHATGTPRPQGLKIAWYAYEAKWKRSLGTPRNDEHYVWLRMAQNGLEREGCGTPWRAEDIIIDVDHGDSQLAGGREKNAAEMHTRLVVEIPSQDIEITSGETPSCIIMT